MPVRALARRGPLRVKGKLEDSWEARCLRKVISDDPYASPPSSPLSRVLLAALNAADPMQAEALHFGRSRVRLAARASAILARAQSGRGIDGPARDFAQVRRMRDLGFDARFGESLGPPWLPRADGKGQPPQGAPGERGGGARRVPQAQTQAGPRPLAPLAPRAAGTARGAVAALRLLRPAGMRVQEDGAVLPPPRAPWAVLASIGATLGG